MPKIPKSGTFTGDRESKTLQAIPGLVGIRARRARPGFAIGWNRSAVGANLHKRFNAKFGGG